MADSSSRPSSGKATPTPSSPREGDLDTIEGQSHPSDGTLPQAEDKPINANWGDESQKKPIKTKPKSEKQPPKYSEGATHKREEKVVTPPPFDESEEPVFHTPTGPRQENPQQPSELWEPKPRPEYLEILTNPIDKFWSETEEDSELHRRQPASHPRNIERRESVELCAIHYDKDYTKYEPIRLRSPSYVYPKVNRTHSATFYSDPKVLPLAFFNAAYIELRRAHTAGEITAEISEKRKQRSRKRGTHDPLRTPSSGSDSDDDWRPFRDSNSLDSPSDSSVTSIESSLESDDSSDNPRSRSSSWSNSSSSSEANRKRKNRKPSQSSEDSSDDSGDQSPLNNSKKQKEKSRKTPKSAAGTPSPDSIDSREYTPAHKPLVHIGPIAPTDVILGLAPNCAPENKDSENNDSNMATTTQDLVDTLTKTLREINQSPAVPLPIFKGKKGEDPEDHILKVEDYFTLHSIEDASEKIKRFKTTLCEVARKWVDMLDFKIVTKWESKKPRDKHAALKQLFLQRFAKEGRTLESAYDAWKTLSFDPAKEDIEQFIAKVRNLARKLGYNKDAQLMAVKNVLPRDVYGICMTQNDLGELEKFLVQLFSNPKMREAVPGPAAVSSEPGVFSIGQHVDNRVVGATSAELDKIRHDMNSMQVRFSNMSATDTRDKLPKKPWKPEVTPPRRRGGSNKGRGRRGFSSSRRDDQRRNSIGNGQNTQNNEQRFKNNGFRSRGQYRENHRGQFRGQGRGRARFDKSPNVRHPRVASKTVDKDQMRCHYCNEPGHFIRECQKRSRDEGGSQRFSGLNSEYFDDKYNYDDDYGDYEEEYEDDVFASLNA